MTKRIKRHSQFELQLEILDDAFLDTPRDAQRNWFLNRIVKETSDELLHLDSTTNSMVRGSDSTVALDRAQTQLDDIDIMEDWQIPIMEAMANAVTKPGHHILEVGMGRGIASEYIQAKSPASHTIIECNDAISDTFAQWQAQFSGSDISLIHALWQDALPKLLHYDGILFHTYPLSDEEFVETVVKDVTFAAHFMPVAAAHLNPGGAFTYLTNESDSLSRAHQRELFKYFTTFTLSRVTDLPIPEDTRDAMWSKQMVIVKAIK